MKKRITVIIVTLLAIGVMMSGCASTREITRPGYKTNLEQINVQPLTQTAVTADKNCDDIKGLRGDIQELIKTIRTPATDTSKQAPPSAYAKAEAKATATATASGPQVAPAENFNYVTKEEFEKTVAGINKRLDLDENLMGQMRDGMKSMFGDLRKLTDKFIRYTSYGTYFAKGDTKLTPKMKVDLAIAAELLKNKSMSLVKIELFTDEKGTFEQNKSLSEQRGKVIKDYLISLGADVATVKIDFGGPTKNGGACPDNRFYFLCCINNLAATK